MSYGLIGLGTMGSNLALNISKKNKLHVYNRSYDKTKQLMKNDKLKNIVGYETIESMVENMETPRTIITLLPHGVISFDTIDDTIKYLDPNDTIIDSANEHYKAGNMLENLCEYSNVNFLGVGMSGGAEGALNGPGIMVGGKKETFDKNEEFLNSFCKNVVHINEDPSSGHYTKMVHNGIEYAMLQGLSDIFAYVNQDVEIMKELMNECIHSEIDGFLIHNTINVLHEYNLKHVTDIAEMNNTGLWCSQYALENTIPLPLINNGVSARIYSNYKSNKTTKSKNMLIDINLAVNALKVIFAFSIKEGLGLLDLKQVDYSKGQNAWSKGTIIECNMIRFSKEQLDDIIELNIKGARRVLVQCIFYGISVPVLSNAIDFYDFSHNDKTSINLLMAQRNKFGQHKL